MNRSGRRRAQHQFSRHLNVILCPAKNLFELGDLLLPSGGRGEPHGRVHAVAERLVEDAHVEVHPLVDPGPGLWLGGVEGGVLAVLVDQVGRDGPGLVQAEVGVLQGRDVVLGVDGQELGLGEKVMTF